MKNHPITIQDLSEKIRNGSPVLVLDVRDNEKYQIRTFSAVGIEVINIPYIEMEKSGSDMTIQLNALPKDAEIITVCTTGNKAKKAAELLQFQGLNAQSLEGGLTSWWAYTLSGKHKED